MATIFLDDQRLQNRHHAHGTAPKGPRDGNFSDADLFYPRPPALIRILCSAQPSRADASAFPTAAQATGRCDNFGMGPGGRGPKDGFEAHACCPGGMTGGDGGAILNLAGDQRNGKWPLLGWIGEQIAGRNGDGRTALQMGKASFYRRFDLGQAE